MAQFNQRTVMTITKDDRAWLSFGNLVLAQIIEKMNEVDAEYLENELTGEIIEKKDIKQAFDMIYSLIDAQESWRWELIQMVKMIIKGIFYTPGIAFMGWFALSYCEVLAKNLCGLPLCSWNFFSVFM